MLTSFPASTVGPGVTVVFIEMGSDSHPYWLIAFKNTVPVPGAVQNILTLSP